MEQDSASRKNFPERGSLNDFERQVQTKIKEIENRLAGRTTNEIITIPIVVHVVHNGEAVGTGTNLSEAQIKAQIEVLNEDFRRKPGTNGFNDSPVGADIEIEFCLSPVDASGKTLPEAGIHRYNGGQQAWTRERIEGVLKPSTIWNPNLFFNIWTVRFDTEDQLLLGYAQFPDQSGLAGLNPVGGPASTDGVVLRFDVFGSAEKGNFPIMQPPYNKGRTLSHEVGHFLGLRHIWGDGPCADDFVADTPPADGPNRGCPVGRVSCGATNMPQNYMDYTDDACMNIFTNGQKARMLAVMELSPRRKTFVGNTLCNNQVVSAPVPNFTADRQRVLLGGEVNFTDLSTNFPTSWAWTFAGGDPATSAAQNPRVRYNTPGTYPVSLVATNAVGASTVLLQTDFITVSSEGLCSELSNFETGFTPSLLPIKNYGGSQGFLTGQNNLGTTAVSEFFANSSGYRFISGVNIKFNKVVSKNEEATVQVVVWNARGPQNSPGSVIERKEVLLKQIKEDVAAGRATKIIFDRETPVFGRAFQVGIELRYAGDTLAIESSAEGEATKATSWLQGRDAVWNTFSIAFGANISMNIRPIVGINPSVQVSASQLLIYPGDEVTLNARGASIFQWSAEDGSLPSLAGPQIKIRPQKTTTVITTGSGLELCNRTASTTIFTRDGTTTAVVGQEPSLISAFPNPGDDVLRIRIDGPYRGALVAHVFSAQGYPVAAVDVVKDHESSLLRVEAGNWASGLYLVKIQLAREIISLKWIKR
jgi:PKD repeat protein